MLTIAVLVMILGLLMYIVPSGPKWSKVNEVGRIMFMVGLFYVLGAVGAHIVTRF